MIKEEKYFKKEDIKSHESICQQQQQQQQKTVHSRFIRIPHTWEQPKCLSSRINKQIMVQSYKGILFSNVKE